jgi:hypothetical protein
MTRDLCESCQKLLIPSLASNRLLEARDFLRFSILFLAEYSTYSAKNRMEKMKNVDAYNGRFGARLGISDFDWYFYLNIQHIGVKITIKRTRRAQANFT